MGCKRALLVPLWLLFILSYARAFEGPLYIRNSHPLFISAGTPSFVSARCRDAVEAHFSYSSTFLFARSPEWDIRVDVEAAVLELRIRKLIAHGTEVALEVPVISYNSGFMDGFLELYHDAFGFPDQGRGLRPHNEFSLEAARNGRAVIRAGAGETALGDLRVSLKRAVHEGDPYVSVAGFVSLPTGDPDRGDAAVILSLGGRYLLGEKRAVEFSFSEDPGTDGAPDFMAALGYTLGF